MQEWIIKHFNALCQLQLNTSVNNASGESLSLAEGFAKYIDSAIRIKDTHNKLIFIGNGGSAGIASHLSIDFSKNGSLPAMAFNDAAALTCLGNDYGYEHIFAKQIEFHARVGDVVTLISSSGKSPNIINAHQAARNAGCEVFTFSGFDENNPLKQLGDLNFYVDSHDYGFVEVAHLSLGHAMLNYILEHKTHTYTHQSHDKKPSLAGVG